MIHLSILLEQTAAEKAKEMGLEPAPFGRWKKDGVVTHRTDSKSGKLVPVQSKDDAPAYKGPTKMTPDGKKEKSTQASSDTQTSADLDTANPDSTSANPRNFHPNPLYGVPVSDRQQIIQKLGTNLSDPFGLLDTVVPDEQVYVFEDGIYELSRALRLDAKQRDEQSPNDDNARRGARKQDVEFRQKLPDSEYNALVKIQNWWQDDSQYRRPQKDRDVANGFLTALATKYKPEFDTDRPMWRGMEIPSNDVSEFMKNFGVGNDVTLPNSGFSGLEDVALSYCSPAAGSVGVYIRMRPRKDGKMSGIHLTEFSSRNPGDSTRDFDFEREIIWPENGKARCINVSKILIKPQQSEIPRYDPFVKNKPTALFIIDMEDLGYDYDAMVTEEFDVESDESHTDPFTYYMNRSIRPPKRSLKMRNLVP